MTNTFLSHRIIIIVENSIKLVSIRGSSDV